MTMMQKSPFEDFAVTAFRTQLFKAARRIDAVLDTHGFKGNDAKMLKTVALKLAKSGVTQNAKGATLLDKVTTGMPVSFLNRRTDFGKRRMTSNQDNKSLVAGYFDGAPGFDLQSLADGRPQGDEFLRNAAAYLDALESIAEIIYEPYHELAQTEYKFFEKTNAFRNFENHEIGHFYGWQDVTDPFIGDEISADRELQDATL